MKNLRHLILLFSIFVFFHPANAQGYEIEVDLNNIVDDRAKVVVRVPEVNEKKITYIMPAVIPGSYSKKDYGRFIDTFKPLDKEGNVLSFKKKKNNLFIIKNAQSLSTIEYWVNDTWDADVDDNYIFQPGGTNIKKDSNFVINHQGFYGYLEDMKMLPYKVTYLRPKDMFSATPLDLKRYENKDEVTADSYVNLVDSPVMISKGDTSSFKSGNMNVRISVYSEKGLVDADSIANYLIPLGNALESFFGTLPVDHYDFIFYFSDFNSKEASNGSWGALEHSYSSFYFIPEIPHGERLKGIIRDIAAHEFLHILTPLNLHAEEIAFFDFKDPEMSKHLWLYEGVTEYFASLSQLQAGLIDEIEMMEVIEEKIINASEYKDISFTKMSEKILKNKYKDEYQNVYQKGALIALLLDIRINELTNGEKNLKSVLLELSKKYGPEKPFKDDDFIDEFVKVSHPEIESFFKNHVSGKKKLPLDQDLSKIGWEYLEDEDIPTYSFGFDRGSLAIAEGTEYLVYVDTIQNPLGLRKGDVLLSIEGKKVTVDIVDPLFYVYFVDDPTPVTVEVLRNGEEETLQSAPKEGMTHVDHFIRRLNPETEKMAVLRQKVFGLIEN